MEEKKKFAPMLPYDAMVGKQFSMYEKMPYHCDRDLCHPNITITTGKIIKYYTYNMEDEITKIGEELPIS